MSYKVEGYWQASVIEEHDELDEALTAARRYSNAHPDTVFSVQGDGFSAQVYPVPEEVPA